MTQRRRLDHFLAEKAAAAGADFRDGVKVTGVEIDERGRHRHAREASGSTARRSSERTA